MAEVSIEVEYHVCKSRYAVIDGQRFPVGEVINVLEDLEECDGFSQALDIDDPKLGKLLVALGAAFQGTRGLYRAAGNRAALLEQVQALRDPTPKLPRWTTAPPTQPGNYWKRYLDTEVMLKLRWSTREPDVLVEDYTGAAVTGPHENIYWWGPAPAPHFAKERADAPRP